MNILIVSDRYPYKTNMDNVFVKKLVDEWAKMGHHCFVITTFSLTSYVRKKIEYKARHYRDEVLPGVFVEVYNPRIITLKVRFKGCSFDRWQSIHSVEHQIKKIGVGFDLIYCHFFSSSFKVFRYAQRNNIPLFVATGESSLKRFGKPYKSFEWSVYRDYIKGVIAVSNKNKIEAADLGLINPAVCKVFPNGTDLNRFKRLDQITCRKELGLPQDAFIIVSVGYLTKRKGQDRVLSAVNKIGDKNIKLLFIGGYLGVDDLVLESEQILYKGTVDNKELPKYYNAADVFCLPTLAEGCCNAVIEALACGLPIVSSNLPFNWDVLDQSNSIMIDPNNVDEISEAIKLLKEDDAMRIKLGNGALKRAESLSVSYRAKVIMEFIKDRIAFNHV